MLNYLNEHLKTRTVLVGYRISVADIAVAGDLHYVWQFLTDDAAKKGCVNVNRWMEFVSHDPAWQSVWGKMWPC